VRCVVGCADGCVSVTANCSTGRVRPSSISAHPPDELTSTDLLSPSGPMIHETRLIADVVLGLNIPDMG